MKIDKDILTTPTRHMTKKTSADHILLDIKKKGVSFSGRVCVCVGCNLHRTLRRPFHGHDDTMIECKSVGVAYKDGNGVHYTILYFYKKKKCQLEKKSEYNKK